MGSPPINNPFVSPKNTNPFLTDVDNHTDAVTTESLSNVANESTTAANLDSFNPTVDSPFPDVYTSSSLSSNILIKPSNPFMAEPDSLVESQQTPSITNPFHEQVNNTNVRLPLSSSLSSSTDSQTIAVSRPPSQEINPSQVSDTDDEESNSIEQDPLDLLPYSLQDLGGFFEEAKKVGQITNFSYQFQARPQERDEDTKRSNARLNIYQAQNPNPHIAAPVYCQTYTHTFANGAKETYYKFNVQYEVTINVNGQNKVYKRVQPVFTGVKVPDETASIDTMQTAKHTAYLKAKLTINSWVGSAGVLGIHNTNKPQGAAPGNQLNSFQTVNPNNKQENVDIVFKKTVTEKGKAQTVKATWDEVIKERFKPGVKFEVFQKGVNGAETLIHTISASVKQTQEVAISYFAQQISPFDLLDTDVVYDPYIDEQNKDISERPKKEAIERLLRGDTQAIEDAKQLQISADMIEEAILAQFNSTKSKLETLRPQLLETSKLEAFKQGVKKAAHTLHLTQSEPISSPQVNTSALWERLAQVAKNDPSSSLRTFEKKLEKAFDDYTKAENSGNLKKVQEAKANGEEIIRAYNKKLEQLQEDINRAELLIKQFSDEANKLTHLKQTVTNLLADPQAPKHPEVLKKWEKEITKLEDHRHKQYLAIFNSYHSILEYLSPKIDGAYKKSFDEERDLNTRTLSPFNIIPSHIDAPFLNEEELL